MTPVQTDSQPRNTGRIILIVVLVLVGVCVLCTICVVALLALSGPAVGNVFSSIITTIQPTP